MDMDKHGLGVGDYNRVVGKGPGSRPQIPKESSMDRSPYFDKVCWCLSGDSAELLPLLVTCVLLGFLQGCRGSEGWLVNP